MTPETLFQIANPLALSGWVLLLAYPFSPTWIGRISGLGIPLILSFGYVVFIGLYWSSAEGGYGSLRDVMALFDSPGVALAGWVHYLAFDLFIGAWIAGQARDHGIAHLIVIPILLATFLFGPMGLFLFFLLRAARQIAFLPKQDATS